MDMPTVLVSGQALHVTGLIDLVAANSRRVIDERYPTDATRPSQSCEPSDHLIAAPKPGTVLKVEHEALVTAATAADCMLELVPAIGEFVPAGAPLLRVHGDPSRVVTEEVTGYVLLGPERIRDEDPA
jgi:uncharacterized membrane protein